MERADNREESQFRLLEAFGALQAFGGPDLTDTLGKIEDSLRGKTIEDCPTVLIASGAKTGALSAAGLVKGLVGQINVIVHALGILLCLPYILEPGEMIEYVSLGAGNTGKAYDLQTNRRIAEFKFIHWQGGPEAIRQNSLFKDFYFLAEDQSPKEKLLYVLGTEHPTKFFNGGRALSRVLSYNVRLRNAFIEKFGDQFRTVRDYYLTRKDRVEIKTVSHWVPELVSVATDSE